MESLLKKIGELNIKMDKVQVAVTWKENTPTWSDGDEEPGEENADLVKQMAQTNTS